MIPPDDRGLLLGDGLFETLLVIDGAPVWWDEHVGRLTAGCAAIGLPPPSGAALREAARDALARAGSGEGRAALRITWTAGSGGRGLDRPETSAPRLFAAAAAAPRPMGAAHLALSQVRRNEGSPASRLKTLAYLDNVLARRRAREAGADEAVMLNNRGEIACASAANLFWVRDERLFTPALDCGVLAGVARGKVIAAAGRAGIPVEEVRARADALDRAQAAFLTNSLIGVRAASRYGEKTFEDSALVRALSAAL